MRIASYTDLNGTLHQYAAQVLPSGRKWTFKPHKRDDDGTWSQIIWMSGGPTFRTEADAIAGANEYLDKKERTMDGFV